MAWIQRNGMWQEEVRRRHKAYCQILKSGSWIKSEFVNSLFQRITNYDGDIGKIRLGPKDRHSYIILVIHSNSGFSHYNLYKIIESPRDEGNDRTTINNFNNCFNF